jgi:outer membrane lipoprotein-sorting protein
MSHRLRAPALVIPLRACALLAPLRVCALLAMSLGSFAAVPAGAVVRDAATARAEDIARIEDYLNGLHSLRATFVQINPNGGTVTGKLYYERPDKMRIDYDPPSKLLIIANGWDLVYQDRKLQQVSHVFTSKTPLGFLLTKHIRLSGDVTVTDLEHRGGELLVTLVQTDDPNQGSITLAFAEQPFELRRWTVIDPQGYATHVVLDRIETDVALDDSLFIFRDPQFYPELRNHR